MRIPKPIPYKPDTLQNFDWETFSKGVNTFLKENEIDPAELAQMDNLMLTGKGVPTKRWGTKLYFQAGNATGSVRGLKGFYKSDGTNELLALTDDGYLTKKSGASYTQITGVSWSSGNTAQMAQLNDTIYIVDGVRALAKYSSPTLIGFVTIAKPTITSLTNISNASGSSTKAYRVTTVSAVGETLGSTEVTLANQPDTLGDPLGGTIRITWTTASNASVAIGTNIYGRDSGGETFIASVPLPANFYDDDGSVTPSQYGFPPLSDSTGGPIATYITRHSDRLVYGGISGHPSTVIISGSVPQHEKFDIAHGGAIVDIEPDAGDDITGVISFRERIIVFKQRSIWQITYDFIQIGNFYVLNPTLQLITASYGCIAPKSIAAVENDIFFLSREGVNTLGYQANFVQDQLRTNTISTPIRPFFDTLSTSQKENAVGVYNNKKYILAIADNGDSVVFDTERGAWVGPWDKDARVFETYFDTNNDSHLLYGATDSANVYEYSSDYENDDGVAMTTTLRTRQEDFKAFELFKLLKDFFMEFRNVNGSVNVAIRAEGRDGVVSTVKTFTLTASNLGTSGFGSDLWGAPMWGTTTNELASFQAQQIIRWLKLNKVGRTMQIQITTTGLSDNYELLIAKGRAKALGPVNYKRSWRG